MEPRQRRRVLYGALLMIALLAGALLIFFLESLLESFRREYAIYVIVPGAVGVTPGSPVWLAGHQVGVVTAAGFLPTPGDSTERVLLRLELPVEVQAQVRADSEIRLTSKGPMSERVVDIRPGTAAAPALAHDDTLRQGVQLGPAQITQRAAVVKRELDAALTDLRAHTPAIRARLLQTQRAFDGLAAAMAEAGRLQADFDASPGLALLRDPAFTASLDNTRAHAAALPALIGRARERAGAAGEVRVALARLQTRADSLRAQLAAVSAALENPNGTLARLQQDSALVRAIGAARAELDSLMADVRRNPLRYVF